MPKFSASVTILVFMACMALASGIPNRQKAQVVPVTRDPRGDVFDTPGDKDGDMSIPEGGGEAATEMCSRGMLDLIEKMEDLVSGVVTMVQGVITQVASMMMGGADTGNDSQGWPESRGEAVAELHQLKDVLKSLKQRCSKNL